ncbi:hypothetical protein DWB61_15795 [Ancylomarina euxinus]|uniref:Uncharacterized protein n=1 Tax=Ancylomarina euxinus TaxID=2283627 RepID=A0A425XXH8_9BACT|nr:hypothetical protein [Ancylomarina euxinus]MCZ4696070.1 hypothetical protein [Ancylomarina euxinus]MUP16479.1 hypothetical protein [Ancylomarina euxinus]RRG19365.1 hypothetical protein DWB61_15795 [Ancylomarina euxinus]
MDPILLKENLETQDIHLLIKQGLNDLEISLEQKNSIYSAAEKLSSNFVDIINFHIKNCENRDPSYSFNVAVLFNKFTEDYRSIFIQNYKQDILIGFGISAIWMGILNGLDAESGIMPNHPFKREIATCLRTISEILDNKT